MAIPTARRDSLPKRSSGGLHAGDPAVLRDVRAALLSSWRKMTDIVKRYSLLGLAVRMYC